MKLLWLDLNSSYAHSSLALPALHAQMADDKSIVWVKVSATINENPGMVAEQIYKHKPDIVASTCWLFNHEALLHITCRVKSLLPQCRIILGGPEFLGDNRKFLTTNDFIEAVFRGEGETGFKQWMEHFDNKEEWKAIAGLCYMDDNGEYHDNGMARVTDLTALE